MADEKYSASPLESQPAGKRFLEFLRGSFYKYILTAVLPSFVFLLTVFFISPCLSLLALPLFAVILLWLFKINKLGHQLALGVAALLVGALLISVIFTVSYTENVLDASSTDGTLVDGTVTPYRGNDSTNYVFTVTVKSDAANVNVYAEIYDLYFEHPINLSMGLVSYSSNNLTRNYSATTTIESPINSFVFAANIDGLWVNTNWVDGPVSSDTMAVFETIAWAWLVQIFGFCFMQLVIFILFLRMSAKSKDARQRMMKDYQMKKEQLKGGGANANVPATADEKSTGTEDTFVCSECGADVKASAKYCPNCGEPFDEDQ